MPLKREDFVLCPRCNDPVRVSRLVASDDDLFEDGDDLVVCPLCDEAAPRADFKPLKKG